MRVQQAKVWEMLEQCGINDLPINYEEIRTIKKRLEINKNKSITDFLLIIPYARPGALFI